MQFPIPLEQNSRRCAWLAVCSTMREPMNVVWDREVVYESVRLLMAPLAAGIGKVSKERWSAQMVLAMKHFVDAVKRPEWWSRMQWNEIMKDCDEVATT